MRWFCILLLWCGVASAQTIYYPGQGNNGTTQQAFTPHSVQTVWCDLVQDAQAPIDGVSDSLPAFNICLATGRPIWIPAGPTGAPLTYVVSGPIVLQNYTIIRGAASNLVTVQTKAGSCTDVLQGASAYSLFGGSTPTQGVHDFELSGFTVDGNAALGANTQSGCSQNANTINGLAVYGWHYRLLDMVFQNTQGYGIKTEYATNNNQVTGYPTLESWVANVVVQNTGIGCVDWLGPHDSTLIKLTMINCTQAADDTYYGIVIGPKGNSNFFDLHVYTQPIPNALTTPPNRPLWDVYSNGGNRFVQSDMEGGRGDFFMAPGVTSADSCTACRFYNSYPVNSGDPMVNATNGIFIESGDQYGCTATVMGGNIPNAFRINGSNSSCPNSEGVGAVDLGTSRTTGSQVASGLWASIHGGWGNTASGKGSTIFAGYNNTSTGQLGALGGDGAVDGNRYGAFCWGPTGGNGQTCTTVLYVSTSSSSTPARLTADGLTASGVNCMNLANTSANHFVGDLLARDTVAGTTSSWTLSGLLIRGANAAATSLVGSSITEDVTSLVTGMSYPTLTADTTNGCINLSVLAGSNNLTRWVATLRSTER